MPYLTLRFGENVLKDFALQSAPVIIGRSPQATIRIDNPAVSHHHARVFLKDDKYYVQDLGSLNGTFLNGAQITEAALREGDSIEIGNHNIRFWLKPSSSQVVSASAGAKAAGPDVPKLEGTMILDTKRRRELADMLAAKTGAAQAPAKKRVGKLVVLRGRTSAREYMLASGISIIGKSENATVKLTGWLAPPIAAMISRKGESYIINPTGKKKMYVNGQPLAGSQELRDGDLLKSGRVQMQFTLVSW